MLKGNRKIVERACVVLGFTALALAMTFPLAARAPRALPGDLGDPLLNAWILGWDAQRLAHGLDGFWNAPILWPSPQTLAYSEHLLGIAILVAPIYWISTNAVLAYNVAFIGSYVLAATGMYLLARLLCGRRDAAVIAALIFAFGPYRAGQLTHLQVLFSGWMPIALWLLHRYFAAPSWPRIAAFAAAFVLQALSNGYYLFFLALPAGIVVLFELSRRRHDRGAWRVLVPQLAGAAALILAALAPFVIVYMDLQRQGFHRSESDWINFSADVGSYLFVAGGVRFWGWLHGALNAEAQLFPGLTAIALAAIGLSRTSRIPSESRIANPEARLQYARLYAVIAAIAFLLSLGPEPKAWGHQFLPSGPYLLLVRIVPGLDGLRAPARIAVVVYLALAVTAAYGAARLFDAMSAPLRRVVFVAIAAFALIEGAAVPLQTVAVDGRGRPQDRAAYRWLSQSEPGAVLELPIREWDVTPTLIYQYATLVHRHPIANGYSGYGSLMQEFLGGAGSPLRDLASIDATLTMLRAIGVRYVLVHPADYEDQTFGEATARAIAASAGHVAEARAYGAVTAFRLRPPADQVAAAPANDAALRRITPDHFSASASHGADRLPLAFDGSFDSRWSSRTQQDGSEWILLQFDRPYEIGRIDLRMGRWSLGDYPRVLSVETTGADGRSREIYHGDVLRLLGLALARGGGYPSIDIDLAALPVTSVRLRQLGQTRRWFWSINEIEVFERR